ncbi:uncharacterized protein LOC112082006 [Eutrema salsugineum]|uniref:uncharacterized protein LOC112082006 n=1 Tax=Eutrema salsugineum TaxID=72664 RepID=UPI000CED0339|nr:uncharacterized protein LOC112082006 [Eutrema salsugineum]
MAFDPNKPQSKDYVRVKVNFDVSRPVRRSKEVILPTGETTTIWYDFERIQKRCYNCQRLTHEKDKCPILIKMRKEKTEARRRNIVLEKKKLEPIIKEADPLFGVLTEEQVGNDPNSGRPKIHPEVLQEMRLYLLSAEGPERKIREEKIKKTLMDLKQDSRNQNMVLRLEPGPILTSSLDKEKGPIYEGESKDKLPEDNEKISGSNKGRSEERGEKLMSSAINAGLAMIRGNVALAVASERAAGSLESQSSGFQSCSGGFEFGSSEGSSSEKRVRRYQPRKKNAAPRKSLQSRSKAKINDIAEKNGDVSLGVSPQKRKADGVEKVVAESRSKIARRNNLEAVSNEGLPSAQ